MVLPNSSAPLTRDNWVVVVAGPSTERAAGREKARFRVLSVAAELARAALVHVFGEERVVVHEPGPLREGGCSLLGALRLGAACRPMDIAAMCSHY